jgi:AraC-like DNA-binding protein
MLSADAAFRGAALGLILVCAWLLARNQELRGRLFIAALTLGLAAYIVVSAPWSLPAPLHQTLMIAAMMNPPFVWAACLIYLDEGETVRRSLWPVLAAFAALAGLAALVPPYGPAFRNAAVAFAYAHIVWRAWAGYDADLVEARRGRRRGLAAAGAGVGLVIVTVEAGLLPIHPSFPAYALQAASLAVLSGLTLVWAADASEDVATASPPQKVPSLTDAETAVLERLRSAIEARVWVEEGLTIGTLAGRLNTAEHRLRRVINQGLGARNFARFINEHRISAAKVLLSDPTAADQPIQKIAFDLGFGSPGPFNRAFRDITGQSPSEFRAAALRAPKPK